MSHQDKEKHIPAWSPDSSVSSGASAIALWLGLQESIWVGGDPEGSSGFVRGGRGRGSVVEHLLLHTEHPVTLSALRPQLGLEREPERTSAVS